jgi:acetyltransferase-like isoleucine patch superfamily enzyme
MLDSVQQPRHTAGDPLSWVMRVINKVHSEWLARTYPFYSVGKKFWAHSSCELARGHAPFMQIGSEVLVHRDVWLNIPHLPEEIRPILILADGCHIGRRCMISAQNRIEIGRRVVISPGVLLMDHNHSFENVNLPILDQGNTIGGTIRIEEGCWIGHGAAIVCSRGELVVGKNSVIGANAVVSRSVPAYSVMAGNPAKMIRQFHPEKGEWISSKQSGPRIERSEEEKPGLRSVASTRG